MGLDEILTPSEYKLVMEDLQNLPSNLVENGVQLFNEQPEMSVSSQTDDSDNSEPKHKRKKPKRMCDSTDTQPSTNVDLLPCLVPYSGQFDFRVQLPADNSAHKWTYSRTLQKVFIDIDKVLALQFKWTVDDMKLHPEFFVRAMPVYTSHDSLKAAVTRCPIHHLRDNPLNLGFPYVDHVMRCEHLSTSYVRDNVSNRYSCITPLSPPQAGADTTTLTYKFVCKTSCLGGMNRRPISVIFTLEDGSGHEFGRQLLAIKVCSCPKRDKVKEEKNELEKSQASARSAKSTETSTLLSVRNTEGFSHPQAQALRDLKNVSFSELNSSSPSLEASRMKPCLSTSKDFVMTEREKEVDVLKSIGDRLRDDIVGQLKGEFHGELKKLEEYMCQVVNGITGNRFWNYVASEAEILPAALSVEFKREVYELLNEKKMSAMRQNMMSYGPTPGPEPSMTSPCPAYNEWQQYH